jgi:hypothetical protein
MAQYCMRRDGEDNAMAHMTCQHSALIKYIVIVVHTTHRREHDEDDRRDKLKLGDDMIILCRSGEAVELAPTEGQPE